MIAAYNMRAGLERVAVEYARGLRTLGHDVTVFTQSVERSTEDEDIQFRRVGGFTKQIALRAATFPYAATRAVGKARQDVVLSFGSSVFQPAVVRLPGAHKSWWRVANAEWPVTTTDGLRRRLNPHHHLTMWHDKRVLGGGMAKAVLAAGDWAAADIRRFYPAVADRVSVLADGVNLSEFSFDPSGRERVRAEWRVAGDEPVLFTVATELRRKGLDTLFEAFRLVRQHRPDARLIVGGKAPAEDVRALVVAHRLGHEARAVGFIEDLRAAYSAADVLMFPTRFDPWGLPVIEAMACGTAVAVSARAGAASVVTPGVNGALIEDPSKADLVAGATLSALEAKPDRATVRSTVLHLSWEQIVARLDTVLRANAV